MRKHQSSSQREASRDSPPTGQGPTGRSTSEGLGQRRPSSSLARLPVVGATFPPRSRLLRRRRCRGPEWTPRERTERRRAAPAAPSSRGEKKKAVAPAFQGPFILRAARGLFRPTRISSPSTRFSSRGGDATSCLELQRARQSAGIGFSPPLPPRGVSGEDAAGLLPEFWAGGGKKVSKLMELRQHAGRARPGGTTLSTWAGLLRRVSPCLSISRPGKITREARLSEKRERERESARGIWARGAL